MCYGTSYWLQLENRFLSTDNPHLKNSFSFVFIFVKIRVEYDIHNSSMTVRKLFKWLSVGGKNLMDLKRDTVKKTKNFTNIKGSIEKHFLVGTVFI